VYRYGEQELVGMAYQRICNHTLGDSLCGVDLDALKTTGTLSFVDVGNLFVESAALAAAVAAHGGDINWFALGHIKVGTETRFITGTTQDDRVYLNHPFTNATVGASFEAWPGDDKRVATCKVKFNNLLKNVSTPYMPNRNPQFKALEQPQPTGGKK
jgi:uncharacterized phage protein (TIGR02218 family)